MNARMITGITLAVTAMVLTTLDAEAQRKKKKPDASQPAIAAQGIGAMGMVTIEYSRPGVKGRDVWTGKSDNPQIGSLVPRDGKPRPWRAGANECTKITFAEDVKIEGKEVAAGVYGLFMIPTDGDWTIIISKQSSVWGSFFYKPEDDVVRVNVTPQEAPHQEWLVYGFDDPDAYGATAYLRWEKVKVPFRIEAAKQEG